jgi:DNA (cytosine-5)-methyltransferase 1
MPWTSSAALITAYGKLEGPLRDGWVWWNLPEPPDRPLRLSDLVELEAAPWDPPEKTQRLLSLMSEVNLAKIEAAGRAGRRQVGTVYRRTRPDGEGKKVQRAEVRFDETAGCLRTPAGGSSRQTILVVEGKRVRTRLLTARETAKLMGVDPDDYPIPANYNAAYHLFGDGLAVPVVRWLSCRLLLKLAQSRRVRRVA